MLVWIFGISTSSKPLQKQSIQALLLSPLSGAFGYSADLHPLTVYKLWASVITRISDSGTQPGLLSVCLFLFFCESMLQPETNPQTLTQLHVWLISFGKLPLLCDHYSILHFLTFIVENLMKTSENTVTYRDWSWIRGLNWPGWIWSSGFWDKFLQMKKHSRPFYGETQCNSTLNDEVYLQTAAQLLQYI